MYSIFAIVLLIGLGIRLALSWSVTRRYGLRVALPSPIVAALLALAGFPDWINPVAFPLPFSLTLGLVLPDFLTRRV